MLLLLPLAMRSSYDKHSVSWLQKSHSTCPGKRWGGSTQTQQHGKVPLPAVPMGVPARSMLRSLRPKWKKVKVKSLSRVRLFVTPWTVAYQAPPSMGFSRQEYWSGLPFPSPGDLPNPGIKPGSPAFQADAFTSEPPGKPSTHKMLRECTLRGHEEILVTFALLVYFQKERKKY